MAYTARAVTASAAPWPLSVDGVTYWARPLSAALALRVVPLLQQPESRPAALLEALRAAFPRPAGWFGWWRDPLRAVLRLKPAVQASIVARLFEVPGAGDAEMDAEAALIAAHRQAAQPASSGRAPSLALAVLTCEVRLGADWYFNPARWATVDGYAPLSAVWIAYQGLQAIDAHERLSMAESGTIAQASGPKVRQAFERLERAAYPADPTMRGVH